MIGHCAQLFSILAWTTGLMVQKSLTEHANVASILFCQFFFAAALLWTGLTLFRLLPLLGRDSLIRITWGILAPGMVLIFSLAGAARTDGVSVALIYGAIPLIGPILARVILGESLHWSFIVGALISFAGLLVLVADRIELGAGDMLGNSLVGAGVICASFSHVIGRKLNTGTIPWPQTATLQVTGAALATLLLALNTGFEWPKAPQFSQLGALIYLIVVMTVLNFLAFNFALSRIQTAWVSLYVALVPAVGAAAAVLLLGSPLRLVDIMGIMVISSGVALPHLMHLKQV